MRHRSPLPSLALRRALDQALERASDAQRGRFLAHGAAPATFPVLSVTTAASLLPFPVTSYADTAYLEAVHS